MTFKIVIIKGKNSTLFSLRIHSYFLLFLFLFSIYFYFLYHSMGRLMSLLDLMIACNSNQILLDLPVNIQIGPRVWLVGLLLKFSYK